ncbi:AAA family ATPase [Pseudomonas fragariae (ex Marin et al. 2024)]|uniref:AAA family ATPase n=1 Tax=Pseudomonas fragariae (ex Marin et al. 2024) TaxID=3080056 RepID=UPI003F7AB684
MRLKTLHLKNFRGYEDREFHLHPEFNLVVGENGTGKTSFLEAVTVAVGSWFLGIRGYDSRNIRPRDIRIVRSMIKTLYRTHHQFPVIVQASGEISYEKAVTPKNSRRIRVVASHKSTISWERTLEGPQGRTTQIRAKSIKQAAEFMAAAVNNGAPYILPLIRYFGAGRLWESVRDIGKKNITKIKTKALTDYNDEVDDDPDLSDPFYGYHMSVDKRCNPDDLIRWMGFERRAEIDDEQESIPLRAVYQAIDGMLPNAKSVRYSLRLRTLVIHLEDGRRLRFEELSDGYRNVLAIAADLAIKSVMLNPQLGKVALSLTPGVVMIDELDLHLHPIWQRQIIESLRSTFPKLQFICTTHSPFLIQSLRSGEELIVLDGQPTADVANMSLEEIAQGLMGVENTAVSSRYADMKNVATNYLKSIDSFDTNSKEGISKLKAELEKSIKPYADNPAFQAFLELKKAVKLGE